jgi:hypothetical protein
MKYNMKLTLLHLSGWSGMFSLTAERTCFNYIFSTSFIVLHWTSITCTVALARPMSYLYVCLC